MIKQLITNKIMIYHISVLMLYKYVDTQIMTDIDIYIMTGLTKRPYHNIY